MADPALPPLPEARGPHNPPPEWSVSDALCLRFSGTELVKGGYVVTDRDGPRVVGFMAPWPRGAVPAGEVKPEEAEKTAREFLQRYLPELFEAGGAVECVRDEKITPYGAYLYTFQRLENAVRVPTRGEVGVRVYDDKVVSYRGEHQLVKCDLTVAVTADRAREIVTASLPAKDLEPLLWLDQALQVITLPQQGQRSAWVVTAEVKSKGGRETWRLEHIYRWQIDARTGEVLTKEDLKRTGDMLAWYRAKGGTRRTSILLDAPPIQLSDRAPVFSPDGKRVLFQSDRLREGFPAWEERPFGLFIINRDGSGMACVVPDDVINPRWSPDGMHIIYRQGEFLCELDMTTRETVRFSPQQYCRWASWLGLTDGRILAVSDGPKKRLVVLDPRTPQAEPVQLAAAPPELKQPGGLFLLPSGQVLVVTFRGSQPEDPRRLKEPDSLAILEPPVTDGVARRLMEYLPYAGNLHPGPAGTVLGGGGGRTWNGGWASQTTMGVLIDPAKGTYEPLKLPQLRPADTPSERFLTYPQEVTYSPDGSELALSAVWWTGEQTDARARLIIVAKADGSEVQLLTKPGVSVVPGYVFPGAAKP